MNKAIRVYKNKVGIWSEENDKNSGTHYLIGIDTLDEILKAYESKIKALKSDANDKELGYKRELERVQRECARKINENLSQCIEEKASIKKHYEEQLAKQSDKENLCKTLHRINLENANVKRGIKPKKVHSGYVVKERKEDKRLTKKGKSSRQWCLYNITIQTPYDVKMRNKDAFNFIIQDIADGKVYLHSEPINYMEDFENQPLLKTLNDNADADIPSYSVFEMKMQTNSREGFWEIILTTNFEPVLCNANYPFSTDDDFQMEFREDNADADQEETLKFIKIRD